MAEMQRWSIADTSDIQCVAGLAGLAWGAGRERDRLERHLGLPPTFSGRSSPFPDCHILNIPKWRPNIC